MRVGDVAKVISSYEQLRGGAKFNGEPALTVAVTRQPGANVVKMVDSVLKVLPEVKESLPPTTEVSVLLDRADTVRHSVADAQYTLIGTALLVILVIYLVLGDLRATMIPAIVLPVAAIGTFAGMYFFGFSLDNLSLLALTLATGFVVDDAIVVLENIVRHVEDGEKPRVAAVTGANEISFTVVSISVSLVAVFIPLLFMGGIIGRLFFEFAVTMTIAIAVSAVLALTLIPMIAARVLKEGHEEPGRVARVSTRYFGKLQNAYGRAFDSTLRHRKLVGLLTVVSIGVAIWGFTVVPKGFFPTEDTGTIFIGTEGSPDISYAQMIEKQDRLARILKADPAVLRVNSILGASSSSSQGRMFAPLKPRAQRDSAEVVQARLRKKMSGIPGIAAYPNIPQNIQLGGRASSTNYQYTLSAVDKEELYRFAPQFEAKLRATPGFEDVGSDYQRGARQATVEVDRDAASRLGVPVATIRQTIYAAYGNQQISTIYTDVDSYQVILEIDPAQQLTPDTIGRLYVRGSPPAAGGAAPLVPLSAVTKIKIEGAPLVVAHQSQLPSVSISFNLAKGVALSQAKPLDRESRSRSFHAIDDQRPVRRQRPAVRIIDEFDADSRARGDRRHLHRARRALRKLCPSDHHPERAAGGGNRRGGVPRPVRDAARHHRHHRRRHADRHRQEKRHHDDRFRACRAARAWLDPAARHPRGGAEALPPDHDDDLRRDGRRAAAGAWTRCRGGTAPAARHRGARRPAGQPGADAVHHAGRLSRHRRRRQPHPRTAGAGRGQAAAAPPGAALSGRVAAE